MTRPPAGSARRPLALATLGAAILLVVAAGFAGGRPEPDPRPAVGRSLPALPLADLRSSDPWRADDERGRPFSVLYVSDRCPHCGTAIAQWNAAARADSMMFATAHVVIVRTGRAIGSTPPHAAPFADRETRDTAGHLARVLGLRVVPTLLTVDDAGRISSVTTGVIDADSIRRTLHAQTRRRP